MKRARSLASFIVSLVSLVSLVLAPACAPSVASSRTGSADNHEIDPGAAPNVELRDASGAAVAGKAIPMDGVAEGLAWPALRTALDRKPGDHSPLVIAVGRAVPTSMVLRAVWTLRDADVRLQTADAAGAPRVLELRPKPDVPTGTSGAECHLAVFVAANGDLRIATPGGPHVLTGPGAATALANTLSAEGGRCTIRYVAFGAEDASAPWSAVFDVARAVDREKSAGDARYVLAEPVHVAAR